MQKPTKPKKVVVTKAITMNEQTLAYWLFSHCYDFIHHDIMYTTNKH